MCRNLKENPNAQGNQLKMQSERLRVQTLLEDCKTEMLGAGGFANLVSLVDSERRDQELLLEVKKKEREATACVKILEGELQVKILLCWKEERIHLQMVILNLITRKIYPNFFPSLLDRVSRA